MSMSEVFTTVTAIVLIVALMQVINRFELPKFLLIPSLLLSVYAICVTFYPNLWPFEPIMIIEENSDIAGVKGFTLNENTISYALLVLSSILGMLFTGGFIRYWQMQFITNFLVYGIAYSLFFLSLYWAGGDVKGTNTVTGNEVSLTEIYLLAISITALPMAIILAWKNLCANERFYLGFVMIFLAKGLVVFSAVTIVATILLFIFVYIVDEQSFKIIAVIGSGFLLLKILKESFIKETFGFFMIGKGE